MKVCVIPARGGSKRIPRKNIKEFHGLPVISYAIKAALSSKIFDKVVVSTDDNEIMAVAESYGAICPFRRPENISSDHTATAPVILHAIEFYKKLGEEVDEVCILYPVNPLISPELLNEAYSKWNKSLFSYIFGVCIFESAPQRALYEVKDGGVEAFYPEFNYVRTQDLVPAFYDAGMFYFCKAKALIEGEVMHSKVAQPFFVPRHLVHDIDTQEDWEFAEKMYELLN